MATVIIPSNGGSVEAGKFAAEADAAVKAHKQRMTEARQELSAAEEDQLDDALAAAKTLVKSRMFGENVYAVVSTGLNETAYPVGTGTVVDIRVESRPAPEQPAQPEQPAEPPRKMTRAQQRQAAREQKNVSATLQQGAQVGPVPSPFMPGSRAEEIAAGRSVEATEHTTVPPATGRQPYMPGNRPEEIAAGRPIGSESSVNVPATQQEQEQAARRNAEQAAEQTRSAGKRANTGRSGGGAKRSAGRGKAAGRSSSRARRAKQGAAEQGGAATPAAPDPAVTGSPEAVKAAARRTPRAKTNSAKSNA